MKKSVGIEQSNPLFRQVYEFMQNRIERGEWTAHDKLPSIRLLADELGVHRLTVFKAYRALAENGMLYVKDKSGYYVSPGSRMANSVEEGAAVLGYTVKSPMSDIQRKPVTYQFSQALIDPGLLPNLFLSDYVKKYSTSTRRSWVPIPPCRGMRSCAQR